MSELDEHSRKVLTHLGLPYAQLLGSGFEGAVYAFDENQVIKIYEATSRAYLEHLATLLADIAHHKLPFSTPLIFEIGEVEEVLYTRERRLAGVRLEPLLPSLAPDAQRRALGNFFGVLADLHRISWDHAPFGQVMQMDGFVQAPTWSGFLSHMLSLIIVHSLPDLEADVGGIESKMLRLTTSISRNLRDVPKRLVHGDYCIANVLFNDDLSVAAVLDFSPHTLVGDPRMDVASAIAFLHDYPDVDPHSIHDLTSLAASAYGTDIDCFIALYTLYYSFYFSDTKESDPATYRWCLHNLRDEELWDRALAAD